METKNQTFSLDFGREPKEMIPRAKMFNDLIESFTAETPGSHAMLITGVRGSGKTVFMTTVKNRLKEEPDWIVVELNPTRDLLEGLIAKLGDEEALRPIFRMTEMELSTSDAGTQKEGAEPVHDPVALLSRMLTSLHTHGKRLLVCIDEASHTPQMRTLVSTFQTLWQEGLPIFLIMTGLYENVRFLQEDKHMTFLYRAPSMTMGALNIGCIEASYARIFGIEQSQALRMAKETKGYAYAFQVLGYFTWKFPDEDEKICGAYRQYLEEYVYEKLWQDLSRTDRKVLYAMACTPGGAVEQIRKALHMKSNQFTVYRTRLIRKGIISGDTYGVVRFELPLFEQFVLEHTYENEESTVDVISNNI